MMRKLLLLVIAVIFLSSEVLHPINMTVSDITHYDKKLHLKIKFFADDLQSTLSLFCKTPIDIITNGVESNTEKCIQKYVPAKFAMSINGVPVKWVYKKSYLSHDVLYAEFESSLENLNSIKTLTVKNIIQFEDFPEQKNIVNVKLRDAGKILIFDNGSEENPKEVTY